MSNPHCTKVLYFHQLLRTQAPATHNLNIKLLFKLNLKKSFIKEVKFVGRLEMIRSYVLSIIIHFF